MISKRSFQSKGDNPDSAFISGNIERDGSGVDGGTVNIFEEDGTTLVESVNSDINGDWTSTLLPNAKYVVKVQFYGTGLAGSRLYEPGIIPLTLEGFDITDVNFFFISSISADPFELSGTIKVDGQDQSFIEVELYRVNAAGTEAFRARDYTDIDGHYSFSDDAASSMYIVKVNNSDPNLARSGQDLILIPYQDGFMSGTQVVDINYKIDRNQPLTASVELKYGGEGSQASPQVGDLVHLEEVLFNDLRGVGIDYSSIFFDWYNSLDDTLIVSHRGLPINMSMIGKKPQLRVRAKNMLGGSIEDLVIDLGVVTNPEGYTNHLYDKIALGQVIIDFSKSPTCGETIIRDDSDGLYHNYYRIWDITQTYEFGSLNSDQNFDFDNVDKCAVGLGSESLLQLINPIGDAGHPAYNIVACYNGDELQITGFSGDDGTIQGYQEGGIRTNHTTDEALAENSWCRGEIELGMDQYTPADSLPVDKWNIVQAYYLPDPGQTAGTDGQTGKFRLNVKSADVAATTPAVFEEAFSIWGDDTRMNLVDSYGLSSSLEDGRFAVKMGTSKIKFIMFSIPDPSVHQITQTEANDLISDFDINNLEY